MDSDREEETPLKESARIQALENTIHDLNTTVTRLRASRDLHRLNTKTVITKNEELEAKIMALTVKDKTVVSKPLNSDAEDTPIKMEFSKKATTQHIEPGKNKKYPDVPLFYGDKDKWDEWRFHLNAKFRQSAVLYPTERDKMKYIRDHCKKTTLDVLKARADPMNNDPYITSHEMLKELHTMFGEFDQLAKCDAKLHSPAMAMKYTKDETFDEFYARFSATIAPLGYTESHKTSTLKRLITLKLRLQTLNGTTSTYNQYVKRLRRCDQNMRL
ncbi:MAG: hypothetical protein ASARMPRED_004288 [Alectoria sarmentosa]|nr:MAG: hypothetical protein ASARMPRED_004288 [Alectoria sarmentosa]